MRLVLEAQGNAALGLFEKTAQGTGATTVRPCAVKRQDGVQGHRCGAPGGHLRGRGAADKAGDGAQGEGGLPGGGHHPALQEQGGVEGNKEKPAKCVERCVTSFIFHFSGGCVKSCGFRVERRVLPSSFLWRVCETFGF